jgi:hypothetical protein
LPKPKKFLLGSGRKYHWKPGGALPKISQEKRQISFALTLQKYLLW